MWDIFKDWIFQVIEFFYGFCGDWGLAIIVVTVIFRIIVAPLMHKQAKSSYDMQKVQPKIQELKERFPDDPTRQSQEMQKIYAEMKFNPLAGCLPLLLQMPIFIALFQVLREMGMLKFLSTWQKVKSFGKQESHLRKCLLQIGLWTSLYVTLIFSNLIFNDGS